MLEPPDAPSGSSPPFDLPFIREFDDRSSLWLFEDPENVRGLVQILDPVLAERLDFANATRDNRSFIRADLREKESDLLFLVPFRGDGEDAEVWVYVLLENKSQPERLVVLDLLRYMVEIWDRQCREWKEQRLPVEEQWLRPIIPLLYYSGERQWRQPLSLAALMKLPALLGPFVPAFQMLYLPLRDWPAERLTEFATAIGYALRVWQAEQRPSAEFEAVLREALAGLEGLTEEQEGQWKRVIWFLLLLVCHRREEPQLVDLLVEQAQQSRFREKEMVAMMGLTVAQQWEARGEARGRHEATRASLEQVLTARFGSVPEAIQQAISAADAETVSGWLVGAATAATIAEVGIPIGGPAA